MYKLIICLSIFLSSCSQELRSFEIVLPNYKILLKLQHPGSFEITDCQRHKCEQVFSDNKHNIEVKLDSFPAQDEATIEQIKALQKYYFTNKLLDGKISPYDSLLLRDKITVTEVNLEVPPSVQPSLYREIRLYSSPDAHHALLILVKNRDFRVDTISIKGQEQIEGINFKYRSN